VTKAIKSRSEWLPVEKSVIRIRDVLQYTSVRPLDDGSGCSFAMLCECLGFRVWGLGLPPLLLPRETVCAIESARARARERETERQRDTDYSHTRTDTRTPSAFWRAIAPYTLNSKPDADRNNLEAPVPQWVVDWFGSAGTNSRKSKLHSGFI
jgi:hypothetical protein